MKIMLGHMEEGHMDWRLPILSLGSTEWPNCLGLGVGQFGWQSQGQTFVVRGWSSPSFLEYWLPIFRGFYKKEFQQKRVIVYVFKRALKLLYKILVMPENRLPKICYQRMLTLSNDQGHSIDLNWACKIKKFLKFK